MMKPTIYAGLDKEPNGGMTRTANIIRDAWVFGILPETETCAGWPLQRLQEVYVKVSEAWHPYGHLPSRLPAELRERHARIYAAAIERARACGWSPDLDDEG